MLKAVRPGGQLMAWKEERMEKDAQISEWMQYYWKERKRSRGSKIQGWGSHEKP